MRTSQLLREMPKVTIAQKNSACAGTATGQAQWRRCDVADGKPVQQLIRHVTDAYGCPDLLINNAGMSGSTVRTVELSRAEWYEVLAINLTGPMLCARAVLPGMMTCGPEAWQMTIDEVRTDFTVSTPLGRMVDPEEVANAVVALHQLSAVTGIDLNVAAGLVMY